VVEARLLEAVRFFWNATRGHRFTPWHSPYLRWRVETYTGKPARDITPGDFWQLFRSDRRQFFRFLGWVSEMRGYADGRSQD
jgi:hypothetical protein